MPTFSHVILYQDSRHKFTICVFDIDHIHELQIYQQATCDFGPDHTKIWVTSFLCLDLGFIDGLPVWTTLLCILI